MRCAEPAGFGGFALGARHSASSSRLESPPSSRVHTPKRESQNGNSRGAWPRGLAMAPAATAASLAQRRSHDVTPSCCLALCAGSRSPRRRSYRSWSRRARRSFMKEAHDSSHSLASSC
eukprot:3496418-Prymnesium_polylepis.2